MAPRVLVAFASKHGSTREVAEAVAAHLEARGLRTVVRPACARVDPGTFDAVVLGGALYTGRLHRDARRFLRRNRRALRALPVAVFAMGPMKTDAPGLAGSLHQLERALARVPDVTPVAATVFGGVVDPAQLRFPFNRMPAGDARDWDAIAAWADEVAERVRRIAIPA
jgi:menaquinone-dependent protoporphyrinogen oxidase